MRRIQTSVAAGALLLLFVPLTIRLDIRNHREFWFEVFDAGHFLLLGAMTLLIYGLLPRGPRPDWRRITFSIAIATILALLTEWLQPLAGRTASSEDLINGLLGITSATVGLILWRQPSAWWLRLLHAVGSVLVLASLLIPALGELRGILWRVDNFPQLARCEDRAERRLWRGLGGSQIPTVACSADHASEGDRSLRVATSGGPWPGVRYNAGNRDWSPYRHWRADVYNPGQATQLNIRIDDDRDCREYDQRFNGSFQLDSGWNQLRVPIEDIATGPRERRLRVERVRWVYLFAGIDDPPRAFFVDDMRLE